MRPSLSLSYSSSSSYSRRGSCSNKDCTCLLCRELKDYEMSTTVEVQQPMVDGANFILRRPITFVGREPTREWQEETMDYDKTSTLEDPNRRIFDKTEIVIGVASKSSGTANNDVVLPHKTVIYFGDTGQREREKERERERERRDYAGSHRDEEIPSRNLEMDENSSTMDNGANAKRCHHEIVVNVTPTREDVLRIEEDESEIEDYWSLPGDTTGFKADWSFVQQWRLRG